MFVRMVPTFEQARDNARFDRRGEARLVEVWRRYTLAGGDAEPASVEFQLDDVVRDGAARLELSGQLSAAWNDLPSEGHRFFDARREPRLQQADIADAEAYNSWVETVFGEDRPASHWRAAVDLRAFPSPTEMGVVRVLLRLINLSDPVDRRLAAYVDPRSTQLRSVPRCPRTPTRTANSEYSRVATGMIDQSAQSGSTVSRGLRAMGIL